MEIKGFKHSIIRKISSEDLMYSAVTIVNKTGLYTGKLWRVDLRCSHHTPMSLTMWSDGRANDLILVIIPHGRCISSNLHVVHFIYVQLYFRIIPQSCGDEEGDSICNGI